MFGEESYVFIVGFNPFAPPTSTQAPPPDPSDPFGMSSFNPSQAQSQDIDSQITKMDKDFLDLQVFYFYYIPLKFQFNPLPDDKILDWSKLKQFADDNFKFDENSRKFSERVENTVGKGEIVCYQQSLLFPQCFQKACFPWASKGVIVWEWVNPLPDD